MKFRKFAIALACTFSFSCFVYLNFFVEIPEISDTAYTESIIEGEENNFIAPDLKMVESFFKIAKTALHPITR